MVEQITYPRLRELLDAGAQLVEVLPEEEFVEEHLPGAINLPLVLSDTGVLLARLRNTALQANRDATAEALMEPGPSTLRADTAPHRLRERLERGKLSTAVITDPDGRLLGTVRRDDLPYD